MTSVGPSVVLPPPDISGQGASSADKAAFRLDRTQAAGATVTAGNDPGAKPVAVRIDRSAPSGGSFGDQVLSRLEAVHLRGQAQANNLSGMGERAASSVTLVNAGRLPGPAERSLVPGDQMATAKADDERFARSLAELQSVFSHLTETTIVTKVATAIPGSANKLLSG